MDHAIVLKGRHVTLEPLRVEHAKELADAIAPACDACRQASVPCHHNDDVYRWTNTSPRGEEEMRRWILDRRADREQGRALAFLQRDPISGRAMGSTSLFDWSEKERCAEIGHTWLARPWRRTGANTEAKLLLLTHGFESLGLARIQLVTDERNERSRNAILRIGARQEGILRRHRRGFDGDLRNSVYFSVIENEWPEVKRALAAKLR